MPEVELGRTRTKQLQCATQDENTLLINVFKNRMEHPF